MLRLNEVVVSPFFSRIFCERSPKAVFFCVLRFLWPKKTTHPAAQKNNEENLHDFKGKLPSEAGESSADSFFLTGRSTPRRRPFWLLLVPRLDQTF